MIFLPLVTVGKCVEVSTFSGCSDTLGNFSYIYLVLRYKYNGTWQQQQQENNGGNRHHLAIWPPADDVNHFLAVTLERGLRSFSTHQQEGGGGNGPFYALNCLNLSYLVEEAEKKLEEMPHVSRESDSQRQSGLFVCAVHWALPDQSRINL